MHLVPVIGLEIHIQLKTKSKMFCNCDNSGEYQKPNTTICPICMGHPGTLPVINKQALEYGLLVGKALNCEVKNFSKFDRKQYFYPDLPKGYQISQYDKPICENGWLILNIPSKDNARREAKIRIKRAHLEEDAAKLIHSDNKENSFIDYNRAGTPLLEIVTEPDFYSPLEAKTFMQELRLIARYLKISDADMEKGHLRCDANISLRPVVDNPKKDKKSFSKLYPKTEIKNINSFRSVERALEYEIKRQIKLWEENNPPKKQSTRGWNDVKQITEEQRVKEEEQDYRYFPEPDLPPLDLTELKFNISSMPELPQAKRKRFEEQYGFTPEEAKILTDDNKLANYTENIISELESWLLALSETEGTREEIIEENKKKLNKLLVGWLVSKLGGLMAQHKKDIGTIKITPENFAEFITMIYQNKISGPAALKIMEEMMLTGKDPSQIVDDGGLGQISDSGELETIIDEIISANPNEAEDYKKGKETLLQFFIGQTMKKTQGKANPQAVEELVRKKLK
jgi:aspartyl-tRNA(Asn)/glutamyl-tRNA(Gln) amidotransferase subunit B